MDREKNQNIVYLVVLIKDFRIYCPEIHNLKYRKFNIFMFLFSNI